LPVAAVVAAGVEKMPVRAIAKPVFSPPDDLPVCFWQ
jgi:hypothetical protein